MADLEGKVAIVTGASRGIGRAIAERLAKGGAKVVVNYAASADAAQEVVSAVQAGGGEAIAVAGDITSESDMRGLFEQAAQHFGRIDIVINNAHPGSGRGTIGELDMATFDQQASVLRGFFVVMQEASRRIEDGGCIISISSGTTRMARPRTSLYTGMKSAIEQFSRVLSKELGHRGVNVNCVSPGLTATDRMAPGGPQALIPPPTVPADYPATKFDRAGTAQEIAEVVYFLASPAGRWINSQNITANGGATLTS
jgi:3-oxoacyl-[acyl-carrier protein] reductase